MSFLTVLLEAGWVDTLGRTLLHFLWQGLLIAALQPVLLAVLRDARSDLRYLVRGALLGLMALAPLVTFWVLVAEPPLPPAASLAVGSAAAADSIPSSWGWVVLAWALGASCFGLRTALGWLRLRRLCAASGTPLPSRFQHVFTRLTTELGVRARAVVVDSAAVAVPVVVGYLKPVVLVPVQVLTGLDSKQIELVLAHELAHVRRADYLANLIQSFVESLLFFHPAVWWVSSGIRVEREFCCDDLAVAVAGNELSLARALTELEAWQAPPTPIAVSTLGGSLMHRIQRLVGAEARRPERTYSLGRIAAAFIVPLTLGAAAFGWPHVEAVTQQGSGQSTGALDAKSREVQLNEQAQAQVEELRKLLAEAHELMRRDERVRELFLNAAQRNAQQVIERHQREVFEEPIVEEGVPLEEVVEELVVEGQALRDVEALYHELLRRGNRNRRAVEQEIVEQEIVEQAIIEREIVEQEIVEQLSESEEQLLELERALAGQRIVEGRALRELVEGQLEPLQARRQQEKVRRQAAQLELECLNLEREQRALAAARKELEKEAARLHGLTRGRAKSSHGAAQDDHQVKILELERRNHQRRLHQEQLARRESDLRRYAEQLGAIQEQAQDRAVELDLAEMPREDLALDRMRELELSYAQAMRQRADVKAEASGASDAAQAIEKRAAEMMREFEARMHEWQLRERELLQRLNELELAEADRARARTLREGTR